jgi:hypothetical protein
LFYFPESSYAYRAAKTIAAYIALRGFGFEEPALTVRESWLKTARLLGVRLRRDGDWNIFWEDVCFHLVKMKAPNASSLTKQIRKEMRVATQNVFPSRGTYLLAAAEGDAGKLVEFYKLLRKANAIAAADAELFQMDRPTWVGEQESMADSLLATGVVQQCNLEQSSSEENWHVTSYDVKPFYGDVLLGEDRLMPHEARKLARLLLAAAHLAEQQESENVKD